ncbi:MAG: hypothetical protein L6R36_005561, partial [Xanthoria steineri]
TREPSPHPSSRHENSQYHSQPPHATSRFDTQSLDIAMSVTSSGPIMFTAAEKYNIVKHRKEEGWNRRDIMVEALPDKIFNERHVPQGSSPLNFHNLAIIISRNRNKGFNVLPEEIAREYSHLRSENDCDYHEMLGRLKGMSNGNPEPSASETSTRRQSRADPEHRVHALRSRTPQHSRTPSPALRSSRRSGTIFYPDHEPESQAMVLASMTRPHSRAPSHASRLSRHSRSTHQPDGEPEEIQAMAIATGPAPESSTYSDSPRMPRSGGHYVPGAPPRGGRWARHEFFAGKYKAWR